MRLKKDPDGIVIKNTELGYTFKLSIEDMNFLRTAFYKFVNNKTALVYREDFGYSSRTIALNGESEQYEFWLVKFGRPDEVYILTVKEFTEISCIGQQDKRKTA